MPDDTPVTSEENRETAVVVLVTAENEEEAVRIARVLVNERLAACVNIVDHVRSIYRWEGQESEGRESLMLVKTTRARFAALQERILALHSYQTPEIIALPILEGFAGYLGWIADATR